MAKAKNYKNEISKQNLDNYSQYNNGQTNLLGSPGFGRSMSKLVQGVAYLQSNRELKIHIFYKSEAGYDVVTNVLDSNLNHITSFNDSTNGKSSIVLTYKNFRRKKSSNFFLNLVFASGETKDITLRVPGLNSILSSKVSNVTSVLTESPYQNILSVDIQNSNYTNQILSKIYRYSDPYNMYNYDGVIEQNLPFVYYLNSEALNEALTEAMSSDVDNEISTRGLGTLHEGSKIQEIHFLNLLLPSSNIEESINFENSIESNSFTYGFIYGENLYNIPDDAPTYYVCLNQGESSYYRTSGTDCDGVTIDTDYTSGRKPARFLDGQCCSTLCDDFSITVTNTSPKDAYRNNDAKGSLKVKVSGGTADYTYAIDTQGLAISNYITTATKASDQSEYEFTGIALKETNEYPFKVTVTDANGCQKIAYIHLNRENVDQTGLILGCTDTGAVNYDSGADLNSGCLWCSTSGSRGETYNSLSFGLGSSEVRALGIDLITPQSTKVTHATASGNSDGKIFFRGEVFPAAIAAINLDADATYRIRKYSLGNGENSNQLTKGEILALSVASTTTALTSPTTLLTSLAPGWYAVAIDVQNIASLANCVSVYRFKVGYGGCTDLKANNYDKFASYNTTTCTYDCPPSTEEIEVKQTADPCVKTVSVGSRKSNDVINWNIGNRTASGAGPHLASAEEYVTVYRENSITKCTSSGEKYIDPTDCNQNLVVGTARNLVLEQFALVAVNTGGCTDETAFNYDCNAEWDNGICIEVVTGCTSQMALNFSTTANTDDGSCIEGIGGCCNQYSSGYNPLANICLPSMCGDNTLEGGPELGGISITGLTLDEAPGEAIGPPCPTSSADIDIFATSTQLNLQDLSFSITSTGGLGVLIPAGMEINAYRIPVGGLTEGGYSINNLTFPLATSGWPVAATWILTGPGRSLNYTGFTSNLLYNSNDEIEGVLNEVQASTGVISLTGISNLPATFGNIGYGAYILEITIPSYQGVGYGRIFVNSPSACGTDYSLINGYSTDADGSGSNTIGCTDPNASNYNPEVTLNEYAAANVGFPDYYSAQTNGFLFDWINPGEFFFDPQNSAQYGGSESDSLPADNNAVQCMKVEQESSWMSWSGFRTGRQ